MRRGHKKEFLRLKPGLKSQVSSPNLKEANPNLNPKAPPHSTVVITEALALTFRLQHLLPRLLIA